MNKSKKIIIIIILVTILDQLTKLLIRTNLNLLDTITIINNFLYITYTKNTGGAWSILENNQLFLILISFIFIIIIIINLKEEHEKLTNLSLFSYSLILGGIIGNLIDRIFLKGVIDFLSFKIVNYYFPIFNIADIAIVIGVILLGIEIVRSEVYAKNKSRN